MDSFFLQWQKAAMRAVRTLNSLALVAHEYIEQNHDLHSCCVGMVNEYYTPFYQGTTNGVGTDGVGKKTGFC